MTTSAVTAWTTGAVLLFWSVGAYNRLVRLRSQAKAAFAQIDAEMQRQIRLVGELLPQGETQPASLFDDEPSFWTGLQGAAAQLEACLIAARSRPLDRERIAALAAARNVLSTAWERALRDDAHDLAGPRLPETLTAAQAQLASQANAAAARFSQAIAQYNEAVAQFPAKLVAWLFGFKPGQGL